MQQEFEKTLVVAVIMKAFTLSFVLSAKNSLSKTRSRRNYGSICKTKRK